MSKKLKSKVQNAMDIIHENKKCYKFSGMMRYVFHGTVLLDHQKELFEKYNPDDNFIEAYAFHQNAFGSNDLVYIEGNKDGLEELDLLIKKMMNDKPRTKCPLTCTDVVYVSIYGRPVALYEDAGQTGMMFSNYKSYMVLTGLRSLLEDMNA